MDQSQGKSIVLYSDSEMILNYALTFTFPIQILYRTEATYHGYGLGHA